MKKALVAAICVLAIGTVFAAVSFAGTWNSDFGAMTVTQTGTAISGTYAGTEPGTFAGTIAGNKVSITWTAKTGEKGKAVLTISADGKAFTGTWGYAASETDGGAWNGKK